MKFLLTRFFLVIKIRKIKKRRLNNEGNVTSLGRNVTTWDWTGLGDINEFEKKYQETSTQKEFLGVPFSTVHPSQRGILFEHVGKVVFEKKFGKTGAPLRHYTNSDCGMHDWSFKDKGVECKSSQLCYIKKGENNFCWGFKWQAIKPDLFDVLVLVGYFPDKLNFWLWDGRSGKGEVYHDKANKNGYMITLQGQKNQHWRNFTKSPGILFHTILF